MDTKKKNERKELGTFTAGKVGNSIKITIPADANVKAGTLLEAYLEPDGRLVYQPKTNENFWDSDFVNSHNFEHDKEIIGELQGTSVGKEV
jgi:antitoxin component of MazEF toxin-antitoxin module